MMGGIVEMLRNEGIGVKPSVEDLKKLRLWHGGGGAD